MQGVKRMAIGSEFRPVQQCIGCIITVLVIALNNIACPQGVDIVVNAVAEQGSSQRHVLQL